MSELIPEIHEWPNKLSVWLGGWVTGFSPSDISGLRMLKNVKFGIMLASNTRMMRALRFLEKVFSCCNICKKYHKKAKNAKKSTFFSTLYRRNHKE